LALRPAHLEIVAVGLDRLVLVVLAKEGETDLDAADGNVLDAAAETLRVPVEEIVDVDVFALVIAPAGPGGAAVEK
jgi:hypothetical protein